MSNLYGEISTQRNFMDHIGTRAPIAPGVSQGFMSGVGNWWNRQRQEGGLLTQNSILGNAETGQIGWGGLALGSAQSLMSGYLGMKQYGLAKQQLGEAKRQFDTNFAAQRKTLNTAMEDRQAARVASNPEAYESVDKYMNKNRV